MERIENQDGKMWRQRDWEKRIKHAHHTVYDKYRTGQIQRVM